MARPEGRGGDRFTTLVLTHLAALGALAATAGIDADPFGLSWLTVYVALVVTFFGAVALLRQRSRSA